ncbi:hypothetical protein EJB05_43631, partial [Eragrostis curvula]
MYSSCNRDWREPSAPQLFFGSFGPLNYVTWGIISKTIWNVIEKLKDWMYDSLRYCVAIQRNKN